MKVPGEVQALVGRIQAAYHPTFSFRALPHTPERGDARHVRLEVYDLAHTYTGFHLIWACRGFWHDEPAAERRRQDRTDAINALLARQERLLAAT